MGIQASKELAEELSRAAVQADRSETLRLDCLLFRKQEFIELLATIWDDLPAQSRAQVQRLCSAGSSNAENAETPATQRVSKCLSRIPGRIVPSPHLRTLIGILKANPLDVLNETPGKTSEAPLGNATLWSQNTPLLDLLLFGFRLEERNEMLQIQWRFFTVVLYRCRNLLRNQELAVELSTSSALDRIKTWIKVGGVFNAFVKGLGPGCLFLFPDELPRSAFWKHIPQKGALFQRVIEEFITRGILDAARDIDGDETANIVLHALQCIFTSATKRILASHDSPSAETVVATTTEVTSYRSHLGEHEGRRPLDLLASAAEAQYGGNETPSSTHGNCDRPINGFSLGRPNVAVSQQLTGQQIADKDLDHIQASLSQQTFNATTGLHSQPLGQDQLGVNTVRDLSLQQFSQEQLETFQQQSSQEMEGFNVVRDLDPRPFNQTQLRHQTTTFRQDQQMGEFNAMGDLPPQGFNQDEQLEGFNVMTDLVPQGFNQGLNHQQMEGFNTMRDLTPQPFGGFNVARDLEDQGTQDFNAPRAFRGFNEGRDLARQALNQDQGMGGSNAMGDSGAQPLHQTTLQQQSDQEIGDFGTVGSLDSNVFNQNNINQQITRFQQQI